jgi:hypothetical protein
MVEDLTQLAHEFKTVFLKWHDQSAEVSDPWLTILMGMVGSCYSLHKATPLLNSYRDFRLLIRESIGLLDHIESNERKLSIEGNLQAWFVGYYLNTAEQRISAALHRLLKTHHNKDKKDAFPLIKDTLANCPHCGRLANQCYPQAESILGRFNSESNKLGSTLGHDYSDSSQGASLRRVWHRVNALKHDPLPPPDTENAVERWEDACSGLSALLQIFKDLASHRGLLGGA